jgi:hypothetical protein
VVSIQVFLYIHMNIILMNENKILCEQNKKLKERIKQLTDDKLDVELDATDDSVDSVDSVDDLVDLDVPDLITESVDDLVDLDVPVEDVTTDVTTFLSFVTTDVTVDDLVDLNNLVLELVEDDALEAPPNTPIKKCCKCVSQKKISKL